MNVVKIDNKEYDLDKLDIKILKLLLASGIHGETYKTVLKSYLDRTR